MCQRKTHTTAKRLNVCTNSPPGSCCRTQLRVAEAKGTLRSCNKQQINSLLLPLLLPYRCAGSRQLAYIFLFHCYCSCCWVLAVGAFGGGIAAIFIGFYFIVVFSSQSFFSAVMPVFDLLHVPTLTQVQSTVPAVDALVWKQLTQIKCSAFLRCSVQMCDVCVTLKCGT